jgi:hypothetical protein
MKEDIENRIEALLDSQDFILFFKKKKEIFAANEGARLIFAKLKEKKKNKEDPTGWKKEASFMATNLSKAIEGDNSKSVFSHKDVNDLKIIDRDSAFKELVKKAEKDHVDKDTEIPLDKIALPSSEYNPFGINTIQISDKE